MDTVFVIVAHHGSQYEPSDNNICVCLTLDEALKVQACLKQLQTESKAFLQEYVKKRNAYEEENPSPRFDQKTMSWEDWVNKRRSYDAKFEQEKASWEMNFNWSEEVQPYLHLRGDLDEDAGLSIDEIELISIK